MRSRTQLRGGGGSPETARRGLFRLVGGEEFERLRRLEGGEDTADCLEAIRHATHQIERHCDGRRIPVSVSIGASREPGTSLDQMLASADCAVYRAKQQGRSRVVIL